MAWSGWVPLGVPPRGISDGPRLLNRPSAGTLAVFVLDGHRRVWQRAYRDFALEDWTAELEEYQLNAPVIFGSRDGFRELLLNADGRTVSLMERPDVGSWSSWQSLGGPPDGLLGAPAVATTDEGAATVYVHARDGRIWQRVIGGAEWERRNPLPGPVETELAVIDRAGAAQAFVAVDQEIFAAPVTADLAGFTWDNLGAPPGGFTGGPTAVSRTPEVANVYVRGKDRALWQRGFWNDTWYDWVRHDDGANLANAPIAAVGFGPEYERVFVLGADGQVWTKTWDSSADSRPRASGSYQQVIGPNLAAPPGADAELALFRPDDLLDVTVRLINLELTPEGAFRRRRPGQPARLELLLPGQHVREEPADARPPTVPRRALIAGPSRLGFVLPDDVDVMLMDPAVLLGAFDQWQPTSAGTVIEFPARLLLQPGAEGRWQFSRDPDPDLDGSTIWQVSYGAGAGLAQVRAGGLTNEQPSNSLQTIPTYDQLVSYLHGTFDVRRFAVSALGASVLLDGPRAYTTPAGLEVDWGHEFLDTWRHDAKVGRDQRVQVITRGQLSSGHRAVLVQETWREFSADGERASAALYSSERIVVTQQDLDLSASSGMYPRGGREMPFRQLRIDVSETPPVYVVDHAGETFWVPGPGGEYAFPMIGTDVGGTRIAFSMPLVFGPLGADAAIVARAETGPGADPRSLGGQMVAFDTVDGARLPVADVAFSVTMIDPARYAGRAPDYTPAYALQVRELRVHLEAVQQFTGDGSATRTILHPHFLDHGLADGTANPGRQLLALVAPPTVALAAQQVGGFAGPSMEMDSFGLDRGLAPSALIPTGPPDAPRPPRVDDAVLERIIGDSRLLGQIKLVDIIDRANLDAPNLTATRVGDTIRLSYDWAPRLLELDSAAGLALRPGSRLNLSATVTKSLAGGPDASLVSGILTLVTFRVAGVIEVHIDNLRFTSAPGVKPDVTCDGLSLTFIGALEFLNVLKDGLPDVIGKAAAVEVTPAGIAAGYALALPSVGLGVLAISNLAISVRLEIPFGEAPAAVEFRVAERGRPFVVTVSLFGGGGFFALRATAGGIESLEASIEFGGSFCLDILGLASGGVYLMAGIYYGWSPAGLTLRAYLRCGGYLSVLGIVGISVEFYAALEYRKVNGTATFLAKASVTVGVRLLFFSTSVTLPFERSFEAGAADPPFAECLSAEDFDEYCLAFAPEPAA